MFRGVSREIGQVSRDIGRVSRDIGQISLCLDTFLEILDKFREIPTRFHFVFVQYHLVSVQCVQEFVQYPVMLPLNRVVPGAFRDTFRPHNISFRRISFLQGRENVELARERRKERLYRDKLRTALVYEMVPRTGIEPARLAALDPKSSASANFATSACQTSLAGLKHKYRI